MRLLIFGHHSDTGFGVVTQQLATRLLASGVDVRVIAVNHRGEPVKGPLAGRVWPAAIAGQGYGGNISHAAIEGKLWPSLDPTDVWQPDVVLVVADMSGLFGHLGSAGLAGPWRSLPVFHYCPIEGDNLPVGWRGVWEQINPVAMSEYGARVIGEHIGRPVPMVYHGVDTDTFHPVGFDKPVRFEGKAIRTKEEAKEAFGLDPRRKVILRTDRNVARKNYPALMRLMGEVFERVPNADLVLHCRPVDEDQNLIEELGRMRPEHIGRVKFTNAHDTWRGLPIEGLVALMNAADIYVSTTGGEGFGLTLAESLACGVPVVTTGWAAETEVVAQGGILVPPLHDAYGEPVRWHSSYGMDWALPDVRAFVEPIVTLLEKSGRRHALGTAGRLHVKRSFNWDEAASSFLTLFEEAHARPLGVAV